jgi:hypothetical protein
VSTVAVGWVAVRELAGWTTTHERIAHLEDQNAALRDQQQRLQAERERLVADNERLRVEGERLRETNQRLRAEVEALRRAAKRQAAPFSRNDPTPDPKRAGRRSGAAHGRHAHRQPPQHVDQVVAVGLPGCCPGCGGELVLERVAAQQVEDLPEPRPLRIATTSPSAAADRAGGCSGRRRSSQRRMNGVRAPTTAAAAPIAAALGQSMRAIVALDPVVVVPPTRKLPSPPACRVRSHQVLEVLDHSADQDEAAAEGVNERGRRPCCARQPAWSGRRRGAARR